MSGEALSAANVCPGEDTLAAFAVGELSDSVLPRVAQHVEQCTACGLQLTAARVEPERLNDRYQLVRKLGEGGMGVVYEADDLVLGERVALKLLRVELASDERALVYFKREAKLSRQIGHAHVCRVFDLGSQLALGSTRHYLSMELLRGPSLRSLLAQGPLEPELALRLADQVLCGLQAAHAAGVLHRDLKPDNVLLRHPSPHPPHAVITDFGLARAFRAGQRHVTVSRTLVGSAAYLAPEQVEEAPLTEATDVYSFGVVLFELLTGEQPFHGETPLGVALKRLHTSAPRPSSVRPELGERYDSFVLRCMARDPRERFQSAASARAALQALTYAAAAPQKRTGMLIGAALSALCLVGGASLWAAAGASRPELPITQAVQDAQQLSAAKPETMQRELAWQHDLPPSLVSHAALDNTPAAESGETTEPAPTLEVHAANRAPSPGSRAQVRARAAASPLRVATAAAAESSTKPAAPQPVLTSEGFLDPFAH